MMAFVTQCDELPSACPFERTRLGNTSLMYTQTTAPCETAKHAMYAINSHTSQCRYRCVRKIAEIAARHAVSPTVPKSSSFLRPTRSITDIAISVAARFVAPTATACRSPEILLAPASAKMSFR